MSAHKFKIRRVRQKIKTFGGVYRDFINYIPDTEQANIAINSSDNETEISEQDLKISKLYFIIMYETG